MSAAGDCPELAAWRRSWLVRALGDVDAALVAAMRSPTTAESVTADEARALAEAVIGIRAVRDALAARGVLVVPVRRREAA